MNKIATACAGLLLGANGALAADEAGARQLFKLIDVNGNRILEFGEIQAARGRMFDRMDANHNGLLDPAELRSAVQQVKSRRDFGNWQVADLATQAGRMDRDGDGKISRDEFAGFIPDRLLQVDRNGDRALSISELRAIGHR